MVLLGFGWDFFLMNHYIQYLLNLLMNFNQICQAGSSLSYSFTEVVTWVKDKYLNTAPNCKKASSVPYLFQEEAASKQIRTGYCVQLYTDST